LELKAKDFCLISLCLFCLTACGYRFAGSGSFPGDVEYVFIEVIENRTSKIGVERIVTNQLIFEFSRQRENQGKGRTAW